MRTRHHKQTTLERDLFEPQRLTESAAPAPEEAPARALDLLGSALAAENASRRRYAQHSAAASGVFAPDIAVELLQHADEKQLHVRQLTRLICELGGTVDPDALAGGSRHAARFCTREGLPDLIREDIVAESVMRDTYLGMLRRPSDCGTPSRALLEDLLAIGEVQVMRLIRLLRAIEPARPDARQPATRATGVRRADEPLGGESR